MPISFDFGLTPEEVMKYLRSKGFKLTFNYDDIIKEAHHRAFTVAKITKLDLLEDVHSSLLDAMQSGKGFNEFKKQIIPVLQEKGWWGEVESINPETGEVKEIYVGSKRLRNIFKTNTRVAYNIGRYAQQKELPISVYWRYSALMDGQTRPSHSQKNGIILHKDDPWWSTNYPPNDWGCRCKVRAYSARQVEKRGWSIEKDTPQKIAGKDWDYDIGGSAHKELDAYLKKKEKESPLL